jgi:hypothetical protein
VHEPEQHQGIVGCGRSHRLARPTHTVWRVQYCSYHWQMHPRDSDSWRCHDSECSQQLCLTAAFLLLLFAEG